MFRFPALPILLAAAALSPAAVIGQTYSTVPQPQSDADSLAAAMRRLGSNPRDIDALVTAGELSLRLGDATAAAAFFARAEKVDPRSGRMKAGEAALLVHEERPGEALRYFDQAVGYGIDPARFAAERGLAYDLIGEPDRAQRDYRVALKTGGDNAEVVRRYALSLGISGKRDLALQVLDPLLRQSDRGAWRARAFILAMTGDVAGAGKIATTMMPAGMATGLQPFFERLPSLPAADRAFAVHFGEVRATPERLADARLVPALPALGPDPTAPIQVVQQPTAPVVQVASRDARKGGKRASVRPNRQTAQAKATPPAYALQTVQALPGAKAPAASAPGGPQATAAVPAVPVTTSPQGQAPSPTRAAAVPIPATPQVSQFSTAFAQNQARWEAERRAAQRRAAEASARAAASPVPVPGAGLASPSPTALANAAVAAQATVPAASSPVVAIAPPPSAPVMIVSAAAARKPAEIAPITPAATNPKIALVTPGTPTLRQPLSATVEAAPTPPLVIKTDANDAVARTITPARATTSAAKPPRLGDDSILAKIIADIRIPESELAASPRSAPAVAGKTRTAAAEPATVQKREAAAKALADRRVAAAKKAADTKAAADKKAAADEKAAEAKLAKADPARVWVQVAGGANAADLAKAWKGVKGKAAALKGKSAYSTPLRATNRLVTGPFKSDDEAQAFVNTLAKQGVSAFSFASTKGQKMVPVDAK